MVSGPAQRVLARGLVCLWLVLLPAVGWAAQPGDPGSTLPSSLPEALIDNLCAAQGLDAYSLSAGVKPSHLRADFNGDGQADYAVLVRERDTEKRGILIVHGESGRHFILGAGRALGNGGDDFGWLDAWHVHRQELPVQSAHEEGPPPTLSGDALIVLKTGAAGGLIYWTGAGYAWYQHGD